MDILEILFWLAALIAAHFALRRASVRTRRVLFAAYGVIQSGFELHAIAARSERPEQTVPMLALGAAAIVYAAALRDAKRV